MSMTIRESTVDNMNMVVIVVALVRQLDIKVVRRISTVKERVLLCPLYFGAGLWYSRS